MNKIYKLIWSQTANAFVAVSELATARGKSSSTTNNAASSADKKAGIFKPVKTALVLSTMLFVLPHSVMAAENVDANNLTVAGTSTFTGAATFNGGITANSITVGGKAVATSDQINNLETKKADKTAVDALDTKKADKTAVDALSNRVTANETQLASLGLTNEYSGIKYFRVKSTEADAKAKATDSVAVGPKAYTETSATKGIAIGNAAQAGSKTSGEVTYDGAGSFMIGDGKSSLAIGDSAAARGNQNIAIGKSALTTNKDAEGQLSTNNIAIGTETKTIAASNAIALGNQAVAGAKGAVADSAIAIGDNAKALAADATAVGHLAQAGNFGLAAGTNAQATGQASVALGQNARSTSESTVAIGKGAQALPWRTISIGQDAGKGQAADIVGDKNEHINIGVQAGENIDGQLNISIGQKAGSDTKGKGNIALGQNAGQFVGGTNSSVGNNIAIGTNANKFASNTDVQETTAIGFGAKASGTRSVALGKETKSTAVDSVAIGTSSQANGASSVAIGRKAIVDGADNVALGSSSVANTKAGTGYLTAKQSSTVVSVGNDQLQRRIVNVADGADDQDAVTVAQLKRVSDDVLSKVNTQLNNLPAASSGINYDNIPRNAETNSITLSKDNKNTIIGNVAPGVLDTDAVNVAQLNQTVEANKIRYFSTKVNGATRGNYNNDGAQGDISLAVGMDVLSTGDRSVTVGNKSTAESKGGIAIGALYEGSAALDDKVPQNAVQTVAKSSNGQPFNYNMAIGAGASSEGNNSIAIGSLAKTSTKQQQNTSPDRAIAIGYFAAASEVKANAIGDRATSSAEKANAFGSQAFSSGVSSTAIGTVAQASGQNSIAMGTHQRVTGANSGSIGYAGDYTPTNVGRDPSGTHADNATLVSGTGTYSVGNTNSTVTSNESGIFGNDNFIQAVENVRVVGNKNTVSKNNPPPGITKTLKDVYITGYNNQVDVAATPMANSKNLFIMGAANKIGTKDALTITDSYVIGTNNTINTSNTASASDDPSNPGTKVGKGFFILGNNVTATKENSVYLGTDAAYTAKAATTDGDAAVTEPVTVGGTLTYGGFAGKTPVGVVTVGDVGKERRIQNVAAGLISATSTDAINGSQLYATNAKLGNVANTVVENFGGNATLNPDGTIKYTNIGNTGKDNIHDAIQAATTKVEGDKGVSVTPKTNADGSKTYTVAAKTDNTTVKVDDNGNIAAVTTPLTNTDGKVNTPAAPNALATAGDIANAINNSGWKATSGATGSGVVDGTTVELINPSETVTFQAGDNMVLNQAGNVFTYSLNKDININSVKFGDNGPTIKADANNNINIAKSDGSPTKITNVADGDVNANSTDAVNGSQLYAAQAAATTKVEGDKGVSVTPTTNADGSKTYTVAAKTDNTTVKVDDNGNIAAVTTPLTNTDGKVNTPAAPNALATAGDIANAINNSGWKATSGATGSGVVDGTTEELINPSETVTFQAGDNMVLNQAENVFTYSLNKDININSVQFNDGPKITNNGDNIKVEGPNGESTKITNVAAGEDDNDAVNVSQLKDAQAAATTKVEEADGIKVEATKNKDGSTTYTVSAKTDGTTTKIDDNGNIAAVTTTFTPSTDGSVGAPVGNGDSLVTANTVADAINNSGWKLAADGTDGTELINPSDTVTFKTGSDNLTVTRTGADITYDLAKDININSVQFNDGPKITNNGDNIKVEGPNGESTKITNVAAGEDDNDAVNVSQLKDAQAAATTKVEEADGIKVEATKNKDGSTTYTVSAKTDGTTTKIDDNGNIAAVTTTFTPSTDGSVGAPVGNGDSLVTANTVADAINNSGFNVTSGATGSGKVDGTTTELINPSETVTFQAGDNLVLNQAENVFTYSLNNDITIGKDGKPGSIGVAGQDGKDGVSIKGDTGKDGEPGEATITVGRDGKDGDAGIDGKVGVNGKDGSAVVLNGKDGSIGLNGKDGKDGLSLKSADGAQGVDGTNGADGLPGKDGKTRLVYQPTNPDGTPNGDPEQVATLNDGLIFTGNNEELNRHKLNTVVKVVGEGVDKAASADFKSATGNINVVADKADTLEIKLNRDLKDLGSATFVEYNDDGTVNNDAPKTTVNNDGITITPKDGTDGVDGNVVSVTKDGLNNGGNNIVNVKGNLAPTYNTGDMTIGEDGKPTTTAATEPTKSQAAPTPAEAAKIYNNAATVGDVLNSGWNLQGNGEAKDFVKPYDTVNFVNGANTAVNVTASEDGKTNEVIVNVTGLPISFVSEAGDTLVKVGDKFYKTEDVENGKPKQDAQEQTPAGTSLVDGDGNKAPLTLANVKSSIQDKAGNSFKDKLAAANTDNPNNAVNVSDLKTAVDDLIGPSDIGGFGLKDKQGDEFKQSLGTTAQITGDDNINTKVIDAVDADGKPVVDANGKPVKALEVSLNNDITIGKDGKPGSIGVAGQDGKDGVSIKGDTGKDGEPGEATITVGRDGKDGDAGIDGKVGVNGKDGSAVVLNGKDGSIGLNGKDGKDGLSLKSADGAQGVDGTNGADGLPGKDGKTRLVYQPTNPDGTPNGDPEQVATLNDGLIFTGNNEELNRHKLNTVVKVVGEGVDKAASADFKSATGNINVVADKADTLEIKLNRDLKDLGSATFVEYNDDGTVNNDAPKTTVNNDGITITPKDGTDGVDGNVVSVTKDGLNNGGNTIVNVAKGTNPTDAVNVSQLKDEIGGLENRVNNRIDDVADDANAGVSSAMAMAALPQAYIPGKSMLTGGIASYNGEGAVAVGFSKLSDNGRWVLKVSGSADTQGNAGGAVGAGFHF